MVMDKIEKQVVTSPDLAKKVKALLSKPFDEALEDCAALKEYIRSHGKEDAKALEEEFREHWHVEAPLAMRQILEEVLDPEVAAANVAATEALLSEKAPLLNDEAESTSLREKAESGFQAPVMTPSAADGFWFQDGSRDNELDYRGPRENPADSMPPIDDEEEDPFADVNVTAAIDKLLSLPFETAIVECKKLQAYVHSSDRGKQEVLDLEAEFKESWSPEAPRELRDLLEELLFPEIAKRKAEGPMSKL